LILSGSLRLLIRQERRIPASQRRKPGATPWELFHRSHPWLMALTGLAPSPADRIAAFMDTETMVDGVPLRVVELTGEPGDMVFCHPVMVHCAAPNRGTRPRFMRIKQQVLTREGRELRGDYASAEAHYDAAITQHTAPWRSTWSGSTPSRASTAATS
jgi:ectoine hydroxylase-related dioxygenase (phytanoyl-CoA dioxygenase family)